MVPVSVCGRRSFFGKVVAVSALNGNGNGVVARCEFCGASGGFDMTRYPARFHRQGRRGQGAMTAQWAPATYSESLDAVCCIPCFQPRFYRQAAA